MAKKVWAEGDILYATGVDGLNQTVLQYVGSDFTSDSQGQTTTETQFSNKALAITNVKKRIVVYANCRLSRNSNVTADATVATFRIKVGTTFATSTTLQSLTLQDVRTDGGGAGSGLGATPSCGVIMAIDESTDFTGDDQYIYVSIQFNSGSAGTAYCDSLVVLGA
jgi:hypothetical protein